MAEAAERITALLFKYDPNQPRDDQGRWGEGGGATQGGGEGHTPAGGTSHMGRSDGTGFKSKEDQARAEKFVGDADTRLGEMKKQYPALKNMKVPHVHVHNSDDVSDANGKKLAGTAGLYKTSTGRIDVALGPRSRNAEDRLNLGGFTVGRDNAMLAFTHEVGHHVHDKVITNAGRKEWLGAWRQYGTGSAALFRGVSTYAATSADEAFAESFAVYTHKSYKGQLPKPLHTFMEKNIAKKGK